MEEVVNSVVVLSLGDAGAVAVDPPIGRHRLLRAASLSNAPAFGAAAGLVYLSLAIGAAPIARWRSRDRRGGIRRRCPAAVLTPEPEHG
jgi:hypothetical protein